MSSNGRALLDAKLALEKELESPLLRACRPYIDAWEFSGGNVSVWERLGFQSAIEAVLLRHYARVVMVVTGRAPPRNPTLSQSALSLLHMDSLRSRAKQHAGLLLRSIDRELTEALAKTNVVAHDDGTEHYGEQKDAGKVRGVTAGYVGRFKAAASEAWSKLKAKIGIVSNVNTNPVAEEARGKTIVVPDGEPADGRIVKRWVSLMDGRERPTHHAGHLDYANNPIAVDALFTIGGAKLAMPGDASHGAPLSELINCRCSAAYSLLRADGTETPLYSTPHAPTRAYRRTMADGSTRGPQLNPTSRVTLNGTSRYTVVLADRMTTAVLRQETPSTLTVSVGRNVVARAQIVNGRAVNVTVRQGFEDQGIDGLIRRSVEHSYARKPSTVGN